MSDEAAAARALTDLLVTASHGVDVHVVVVRPDRQIVAVGRIFHFVDDLVSVFDVYNV